MASKESALRICPLCEATCGLVLTIDGTEVTQVRGDAEDVFSRGYICPKGVALGELHADPRRLTQPMVRQPSGELAPVTWDEAFSVIRERLTPIISEHGPQSVGLFLGNPNVHNLSGAFYLPAFIKAVGTTQRFSASTVDQMPKQVACALMYGTALSVPVPDIDRTHYFLMLGANPLVSNGSMMTAADFPGRLRALRKRGGRLVVVDPIRTKTAAASDEHLVIRPGSDALWLASLAYLVTRNANLAAAETWIDAEEWRATVRGLEAFTPEATSSVTGIDADTTRRIAAELVGAPSAAVYGRMGTTTSGFTSDGRIVPMATLASWLIDVINIAIGSLDRPGGVMFPLPVAGGPSTEGTPGSGHGVQIPGRRRTRVRGLPSALGEFPASALAEEIDTPDPDTGEHIRAVFVVGGNPIVSTPNQRRLTDAFRQLDLLVSVDPYLTATNELADVILPVASPLTRPQHDVVFNNLAVRNQARYSPALFPVPEGEKDETEVLAQLAAIAAGIASGHEPTAQQIDDLIAYTVATQACTDTASRAHGRTPEELLAAVSHRSGVDRILDLRIRSGPYGDGFGSYPDGLTLQHLIDNPHGIDLGPLQPRLPEVLRTRSGRIDVGPQVLLDALLDATQLLDGSNDRDRFTLVGRRQLRSNNSWMKGLPTLTGGSNTATAMMNPADAADLGIHDGSDVTVSTSTGSITLPVALREDISPGCVCIPHGWAEANVNALVDVEAIDSLAGTSVLSGLPVSVTSG
jgi:anaerobic selenocysteine-containing dehydrogenase